MATFDGSHIGLHLNGNMTASLPLSTPSLAILYTEAELAVEGACGTQKSQVMYPGVPSTVLFSD